MVQDETMLDQEQAGPLDSFGELIVVLTHSKGNYPLPGGVVTVYTQSGQTIASTITDQSGRTAPLRLATPARSASLTPGGTRNQVAAYYTVQASAEDYLTAVIPNIPVFSGVSSIQNLDLVYGESVETTLPIQSSTEPTP